jgi:hypothetical protein
MVTKSLALFGLAVVVIAGMIYHPLLFFLIDRSDADRITRDNTINERFSVLFNQNKVDIAANRFVV